MARINTADILHELATRGMHASLIGDHRTALGFCSLRAPTDSGVYFATSEVSMVPPTRNSIVICDARRDEVDLSCNSLLVTADPQRAFYVLQHVYHPPQPRSGIHQTVVIDEDAVVSASAYIGPYCVIGRSTIGPDCVLESHVVVRDNVTLESGVTVESHSTLGATGVAWVWDETNGKKIVQPQTGGVHVGEGSFIGTDVTIVRGSVNEMTTVGENCQIAHGTKIGHSCRIGPLVHFANNVTIAGGVTIGRESFLSSGCVIRPRITLPRGTTVGAGAVVVSAPEGEYMTVIGVPARSIGPSKTRMAGIPYRSK
jgi:UDP-3-O-[3-hydroxymyristoyl] glucosamine N-acyltransferase